MYKLGVLIYTQRAPPQKFVDLWRLMQSLCLTAAAEQRAGIDQFEWMGGPTRFMDDQYG